MKPIAVILLLTTIISCHKGEDGPATAPDIVGSWELRKSEGGFAGTILYSPGNGAILRFEKNSQYTILRNSSVYETGSYQLKRTSTPGEFMLELTSTGSSTTTTISIQLNASMLILLPASSCCDIATYTYDKI